MSPSSDKLRYESWEEAHRDDPDRPIMFAATVVVIRDAPAADPDTGHKLEVLLLKRAKELAFGGGSWVFPGGKIDAADLAGSEAAAALPPWLASLDSSQERNYRASQTAGIREAHEEAGLQLTEADLVCFSHWVPPPIAPKRFATWFFLAEVASEQPIVIDDGEIVEYQWLTPQETLRLRNQQELDMLPPTYVTLTELAECANCAEAVQLAQSRPPPLYATKIAVVDDGAVSLWEGDAGYASGQADVAGPRHRLVMEEAGWVYQRS